MFFIDSIIKVLSNLDHSQPYLLSDALWWPEHGKGMTAFSVLTGGQGLLCALAMVDDDDTAC